MDAFLISTGVISLVDTGDKTRIATVVLSAQCNAFIAVVAGTTFGMMLANVPAVLLGAGARFGF